MSIPNRLDEDLTPWLAEELGAHGHLGEATATTVGLGEGFVGQVARVRLDWVESTPSAPSTVIVKLPSTEPINLMVAQVMAYYDRESRFYEDLAGRVPVRVPTCFANHAAPEAGEYALVLEDLEPLRCGDQVAGASLAQARLVVRELARLHAAFYRPGALDGLDWLPGLTGPMTDMIVPMFDGSWSAFVDHYGSQLSPRLLGWAESFARQIPTWLETYADQPVTLVHGDGRLDNMFFGDDDAFALLDWQMAMRVPGVTDLAFFLVTNFAPDGRRAHERELIDSYVAALRAEGVAETLVASEVLQKRYVEAAMLYAVMFVSTISYDRPNRRAEKFFDCLVLRTFAAVDDLDAGIALGL